MYRYNQRSHEIREKLCSLEKRRPANVDPRRWEEAVGWAVTAHCNVCFSEEHVSYEEMCRFEEDLDKELEGDVDLGTIEWIGDRLAETGPHGQRYIANFREQWKEVREWEKRQEQPQGR